MTENWSCVTMHISWNGLKNVCNRIFLCAVLSWYQSTFLENRYSEYLGHIRWSQRCIQTTKMHQICQAIQSKTPNWPRGFHLEFCLQIISLCYLDLDEECRNIRSKMDDLISEYHESLSYIRNFRYQIWRRSIWSGVNWEGWGGLISQLKSKILLPFHNKRILESAMTGSTRPWNRQGKTKSCNPNFLFIIYGFCWIYNLD
jgi:hypothetical protein